MRSIVVLIFRERNNSAGVLFVMESGVGLYENQKSVIIS